MLMVLIPLTTTLPLLHLCSYVHVITVDWPGMSKALAEPNESLVIDVSMTRMLAKLSHRQTTSFYGGGSWSSPMPSKLLWTLQAR